MAPEVLPPVEEACDCRDTEMPRLMVLTCTDDVSWKDPTAWRFEYKATYVTGGSGFHTRAICGPRKRETAIKALQAMLAGMGVVRIRLYHVEPPPSEAKVRAIEEFNRRLLEERSAAKAQIVHHR